MLRRIPLRVLWVAVAGALLAGCAYYPPGYYFYNGDYHYSSGGFLPYPPAVPWNPYGYPP